LRQSLIPVVLAGFAAFLGLYAMFYYAGGSVGGALPALFWTSGGWRACVALVVAVQVITAAIGWLSWTGGRPAKAGRYEEIPA
jgi:hypothetical protein